MKKTKKKQKRKMRRDHVALVGAERSSFRPTANRGIKVSENGHPSSSEMEIPVAIHSQILFPHSALAPPPPSLPSTVIRQRVDSAV